MTYRFESGLRHFCVQLFVIITETTTFSCKTYIIIQMGEEMRRKGILFSVILSVMFFVGVPYAWATPNDKPLVLAVHPFLPSLELLNRFTPLAEYLSKAVGRPVEVAVSNSFESHIEAVGNGRVDIAHMNPASYIKLVDRYGTHPILGCLEVDGRHTFYGVIFTTATSPIKTLSDLKGKRVAFVDRESTMGHVVPRYMLYKAGIKVEDFGGYDFLKNHESVALSVLSGNFDAGAIKSETYIKYKDKGIRALAFSDQYSEHLLVVRKDLDSALAGKLKDAILLLQGTEQARRIASSINPDRTGFTAVTDHDYDNLRDVMRTLKKLGLTQ